MIRLAVSIVSAAVVCCMSLCWTADTAFAGSALPQLKETVDKVIEVSKDKNLKKPSRAVERRKAIRKLISERFDFEEMAKRSLAIYWQQRTPQERAEFVPLYTDLLERSYMKKIEDYDDEKVVYIDEVLDGSYAVVKTRIVTRRNGEIPVDYRLLAKGKKWEIYDVSIEGVSVVNNYRSQFNKIIRTSSYQDLVKKMKNKQAEELFEEKDR